MYITIKNIEKIIEKSKQRIEKIKSNDLSDLSLLCTVTQTELFISELKYIASDNNDDLAYEKLNEFDNYLINCIISK